jgi:hypothetical protein
MFRWSIFHKPVVASDNVYMFYVELTWGETLRFKNMEFIWSSSPTTLITSLSPKGNDSGTVFVGMVLSGSPSLHAILEESTSEDDLASSDGGSFDYPIPRD